MKWFVLLSLLLHACLLFPQWKPSAGAPAGQAASVRVAWKNQGTETQKAEAPAGEREADTPPADVAEQAEVAEVKESVAAQAIAAPAMALEPKKIAEQPPQPEVKPKKKPEAPPKKTAAQAKPQPAPPKADMEVAQKSPANEDAPLAETQAGLSGGNKPRGASEQLFGQAAGPSYKSFVPPPYPARAKQRRQEGFVLLRVLINAQGKADRWEVVEASNPVFVAAAEQSLRLSSFHPYTEDGQARDCWVRLPLRFTLR